MHRTVFFVWTLRFLVRILGTFDWVFIVFLNRILLIVEFSRYACSRLTLIPTYPLFYSVHFQKWRSRNRIMAAQPLCHQSRNYALSYSSGITSHNIVSVVFGAERISVVRQVGMCIIGRLFTRDSRSCITLLYHASNACTKWAESKLK